MNEEMREKMMEEVKEVLNKYVEYVAAAVVGFTYRADTDEFYSYSRCFVPVGPRDHEDNILSNLAAVDVAKVVKRLTENIYGGE